MSDDRAAMPTTGFDAGILDYLNNFARESYPFDVLQVFLSTNHLVKGGLLLALFWWAWFKVQDNAPQRARLGATLVACLAAIILGRVAAVTLPFRLRPIHDPELAFLPPFGMSRTMLDGWSSFPSDHAVLFYALATGLYCTSRRLGLFALVYVTLLISFPRIYLGLHFPTDIIAGALLGVTVALCLQHPAALRTVGQPLQNLAARRPALFYPLLFLLCYQIADMFNNARAFGELAEVLSQG